METPVSQAAASDGDGHADAPFGLYGDLAADIWLYMMTSDCCMIEYITLRVLCRLNSAFRRLVQPILLSRRKLRKNTHSIAKPVRKFVNILSSPQSFAFLHDGSILVLLQRTNNMEMMICGAPLQSPKTRILLDKDDNATDLAVMRSTATEISGVLVVAHANRLKIFKMRRKSALEPFKTLEIADSSIGTTGLQPAELWSPMTCTLDANGLLLVTSNHAVKHYNARTGDFIGAVGDPKWRFLQLPFAVAVDEANSGRLVVTDSQLHSVQVWSNLGQGGKRLLLIGYRGTEKNELMMPRGVDVDKNGNIYVAEHRNNRVQVFDSSGKHLHEFGRLDLNGPSILRIRDDGRIYVCDSSCIWVY